MKKKTKKKTTWRLVSKHVEMYIDISSQFKKISSMQKGRSITKRPKNNINYDFKVPVTFFFVKQ